MGAKRAGNPFEKPEQHVPPSFEKDAGEAYNLLLREWIETQKEYAAICEGEDFGHQYSERPHIGFFSAGVWRLKGVAIEEWRAGKQKEGQAGHGRCDLWFCLENGFDRHLEAKHIWLKANAKDPKNTAKLALKKMKRAAHDAVRIEAPDEIRTAMLIAALFYRKKSTGRLDATEVSNCLRNSFKEIKKSLHDCAYAALFLTEKNRERDSSGLVYLGAAIFLKDVKAKKAGRKK